MNLYRLLLLLFIPTLITITSCGSDDDSDSSVTAEEDTTGTTGGTGGGGSGSCLSTSQRNNIRIVLDRLSDRPSIEGNRTDRFRTQAGTYETQNSVGGYAFRRTSQNAYAIGGGFCTADNSECFDLEGTLAFRDGCFYYDGRQSRILSTSSRRISISTTYTDRGVRFRELSSVNISPIGRVTIRETIYQNGVLQSRMNFSETGPGDNGTTTGGGDDGTTTGGDDGTTTGGDTGSTTGGDTGSTTGGTTTGETGTTTGGTGTTTGGQTP